MRRARSIPMVAVLGVCAAIAGVGHASPPSTSAGSRGRTIVVSGAYLEVEIAPGPLSLSDGAVIEWIERAARSVANYFGGFPTRRARISIEITDGSGVNRGRANGWGGERVAVALGVDTTTAQLERDWVLTHEMVHLGFPSLAKRHHWMEEGLATYVEPLGRARAGILTAEEVFGEMVREMPRGLPAPGDRGLDFTPTWARTYWGGALYWLLVDVGIRERTAGRKGLEDALRAIVRAGGTLSSYWSIDRVISTGDRATGTTVMRETYDRMKDRPARIDLSDLWRRLGVVPSGPRATLVDAAPLAAVRRAMVTGRP